MKIQILRPADDVSNLDGLVVVIDVFRAFSTNYFIADKNPEKIIATNSIEVAFLLKEKLGPNVILVGERQGIKIEGFDFGNSPTEIQNNNIENKIIVHTTTAGTKGLLKQNNNVEVICGSFVNAYAIQKYIKDKKIKSINLYCTSNKHDIYGEEDYYFADYLKAKLENKTTNFEEINSNLRNGSGAGFKEGGFAPETDFHYCMALDTFNFVLKRKNSKYQNCVELEKII